ncbi:YhcH/YjgK/YiaL family protein [Paenibacillus koleovorans]|uniref:YhcH/YjgK/YiaL family protein n=1 Tax=Paenibacillus koleovorans TaxID=121608 RepID=UPI0013E3F350|nr:YhcH/YjgK/YiaL family protein [Paenibacillus koleovorans]
MILDRLSNAANYYGIHPQLAAGFRYLQEHAESLPGLAPGKYEIDGNDLYFLVQHYNTKPLAEGKWEAHRRYFDIQYLAEGTELMGFAHLDQVRIKKEYDEAGDYALFEGDEGSLCEVTAGSFAVFAPQDAHIPGIAVDEEPAPVKKIVVKVLI